MGEDARETGTASAAKAVLVGAEHLGKALTVIAASVYLLGYIVTASRLASYQASAPRLFDAQYFAAGLLPACFLWLVAFAVVHAWRYDASDQRFGISHFRWFAAQVLALVVVAGGPVAYLVVFDPLERQVNLAAFAMRVILGVVALAIMLWIVIVGVRHRLLLSAWNRLRRATNVRDIIWGTATGTALSALLLLLALMTWAVIPGVGDPASFYSQLPQAFGGGRLVFAQLYVDVAAIPSELVSKEISTSPGKAAAGAGEGNRQVRASVPVAILFQTPDEYIVYTGPSGFRQVWSIRADAVKARVSLSYRDLVDHSRGLMDHISNRAAHFDRLVAEFSGIEPDPALSSFQDAVAKRLGTLPSLLKDVSGRLDRIGREDLVITDPEMLALLMSAIEQLQSIEDWLEKVEKAFDRDKPRTPTEKLQFFTDLFALLGQGPTNESSTSSTPSPAP